MGIGRKRLRTTALSRKGLREQSCLSPVQVLSSRTVCAIVSAKEA